VTSYPRSPPTWRLLLRGELLLLHLVAALAVGAMLFAGSWQLDAWRQSQADDRAAKAMREPVPLSDLLGPDDPITAEADGAAVRVEGRWAPVEDQFLVTGRGPGRSWVVSPLLVDGTESAVLVVRGSTDAGDLPPLAAGPVSVTGVVAPSEPFSTAVGRGRRIESVNVSVLVGSVPYDLYSVYVVRTAQSPPDPAQLDPVAVSLPEASWTAGARNLAYGIQWWVFAAFTTFMWWRVACDRVQDHRALDAAEAAAGQQGTREPPRTPVA
jgi:cytochrome oxidase assembly protein ShyY1